jgi:carbohydrate-binding DOMON domain-containing protein
MINYQLAKYRNHIDQINRELEKFEASYKMSSQQFYKKFEAGELGDDEDFFEWNSLLKMCFYIKKG